MTWCGLAVPIRTATPACRVTSGVTVGEVVAVRATWALPDQAVRGVSRPEPVYTVRFAADELWGAGSHSVTLDLWESYVEEVR